MNSLLRECVVSLSDSLLYRDILAPAAGCACAWNWPLSISPAVQIDLSKDNALSCIPSNLCRNRQFVPNWIPHRSRTDTRFRMFKKWEMKLNIKLGFLNYHSLTLFIFMHTKKRSSVIFSQFLNKCNLVMQETGRKLQIGFNGNWLLLIPISQIIENDVMTRSFFSLYFHILPLLHHNSRHQAIISLKIVDRNALFRKESRKDGISTWRATK